MAGVARAAEPAKRASPGHRTVGDLTGRSRITAAIRLTATIGVVVYPVMVYYGLTHWQTRHFAVGVAVFFLAIIGLRVATGPKSVSSRDLVTPLTVLILAIAAFSLDNRRVMLALPVGINVALLALFGVSLRGDVSIIERFARLQAGDIGPQEVRYCRSVTKAWCAFFAVNGFVAAVLALLAPFSWWALYTGGLSYVLVGLLFACEYMVRIYRFPHARPLWKGRNQDDE